MISKNRIASFAVDVQNGFTPHCPQELPVPGGNEIVPDILFMESMSGFHIASKDWHHPKAKWVATETEPQFTPIPNEENLDIRWTRHCEGGTFGAELLAGLKAPKEYSYFIWKGMEFDLHPYSAVYHDLKKQMSTGAIEVLKANGIETVIVGGLATDYCVKETALDLRRAGFEIVLYLPSCRGITAETTVAAIAEMADVGIKICHSQAELTTIFGEN